MTLYQESPRFAKLVKEIDLRSFEGARILITGGTGLIGGYLSATLAVGAQEQGVRLSGPITVTGSRSAHFQKNLIDSRLVEIVPLDSLLERSFLKTFTHTFHAASPASPDSYSDSKSLNSLNSEMIPKLMQRTTERFVYFSTGEVYGTNSPLGVKENFKGTVTKLSSRAAYPDSKQKGEKMLYDTISHYECTAIIARLFHTFGPGISANDSRTFSSFIYQGINNGQITMYSDGRQIRSFLHLSDTIAALVRLVSHKSTNHCETFNIGSCKPFSIKEFAELIAEITNSRIVFAPADFSMSPNPILLPNTDRLQELGWEQKVDINECLQDTISWVNLSNERKQF